MANEKAIRDTLIQVMADAIRGDGSERPPDEVAVEAAQATGLRRAIWAALTPRQRQVLITRARARASVQGDAP